VRQPRQGRKLDSLTRGSVVTRLRRTALAVAAGLLMVAAHDPLGWWPLAWVGLVPWITAILPRHGERPGGAWPGFVFGLVLHLAGLHWMNRIGAGPWIALALLQAAWFAVFGAVAGRVLPRLGPRARALAFAAGWVTFEWVRSSGPYAFPWFLLASAHTRESALPWLQIVSLGGQWGLSFAAAYANGLLAEAFSTRRGRWLAGAAALAMGLGAAGSVLRTFVELDALSSDARRVRIAVVQGAEDRGTDRDTALALYSRLTREAPRDVDLVVWPEGTVPGDPAIRASLDALAREIGTPILAGMIESNPDGTLANSLRLFPESTRPVAYVKRQIVPFGEFFPARAVLGPIFERYGVTYPDFKGGARPGVFRIGAGDDAFTVGTAICYESAFPYVARDTVRAGADVLVFTTSDQTFDGTVELEQHLDLARVRAVETGRWLVRAASTGVSAVLRPDGRTIQSGYAERASPARLPVGRPGVLVATVDLPAIRGGWNDATRAGDGVAWWCVAGAAAACVAAWRRRGVDQTGKP